MGQAQSYSARDIKRIGKEPDYVSGIVTAFPCSKLDTVILKQRREPRSGQHGFHGAQFIADLRENVPHRVGPLQMIDPIIIDSHRTVHDRIVSHEACLRKIRVSAAGVSLQPHKERLFPDCGFQSLVGIFPDTAHCLITQIRHISDWDRIDIDGDGISLTTIGFQLFHGVSWCMGDQYSSTRFDFPHGIVKYCCMFCRNFSHTCFIIIMIKTDSLENFRVLFCCAMDSFPISFRRFSAQLRQIDIEVKVKSFQLCKGPFLRQIKKTRRIEPRFFHFT